MSRRANVHPAQIAFEFEVPQPATAPGSLAGVDRQVSALVARALREDQRPRPVIAAEIGVLLDEDVSVHMLNAYASEAREGHNISLARGWALFAATGRFDLLDALAQRFGCRILVGDEVLTAELGHIDRRIAELQDRKRTLQAHAKPISRGRPVE